MAFGTDDSTPVTEELKDELARLGHEVLVVADPLRWAQAGQAVAETVASGQADVGVVCCFTGTGVAMAANKVAGAGPHCASTRRQREERECGTTLTYWP